ncbi:MAG TPA: hypothetical protein DCK95_00365 [Anaerolineaceae bacterium]|nr:hypothetical protein [Anaerolineaceae bacterium]
MFQNVKDRFDHASKVTEWKVDQQKRIYKTREKISDYENQIGRNKIILADKAYQLFIDGKLKDKELLEICADIKSVLEAIDKSKQELEAIKQEKPPEMVVTVDESKTYSGLICPVCGKKLIGKFCPDDGAEGVPVKKETAAKPEKTDGEKKTANAPAKSASTAKTTSQKKVPAAKKEDEKKEEG